MEEYTTCCYAVQDKVWVNDPDGAPWEVYTVFADAPMETGMPGRVARRPRTSRDRFRDRGFTAIRLAVLLLIDRGSRGTGKVTNTVLWRRLLAEFLGNAFLAAMVIGSGIAAQNLSPGNVGLQLFENAVATATGLFAIILMFGPSRGPTSTRSCPSSMRGSGAVNGARQLPTFPPGRRVYQRRHPGQRHVPTGRHPISTKDGASGPHLLSEVMATIGLILVIFALARTGRSHLAPAAVGAYIGAAYFFTSSTSFANPAITVGRMFSNSFAGIAPSSVPNFISAQVVGGVLAFGLIKCLYPGITKAEAADVIEPHLRGENDLETR